MTRGPAPRALAVPVAQGDGEHGQTRASAPLAAELHGPGRVGSVVLELLRDAAIPVAFVRGSRGVTFATPVQAQRHVLVDCTPPRYGADGEAHVRLLEHALASGTHVVTCNKAPLATAWARLQDAAQRGGSRLLRSATVGAGTPVLASLALLQETHGVTRVEATLSGTLAFVAGRVHAGASLQEAVAQAQALGYCEPDPRVDLDGLDLWAKACIVHNSLWPERATLQAGDLAAPLRLDETVLRSLRSPGVVASIEPGRASLQAQEWPAPADPCAIRVRATLADGSTVSLEGPGAGPAATARAVVRDVRLLEPAPTRGNRGSHDQPR